MSKFSDLAGTANAQHFAFFGDRVTLVQTGSPSQTIDAVIGKVRTESRTDESGRHQRVSLRDVRLLGLTSVRHDARITIDSLEWSINQVRQRNAAGINLTLMRVETHDVTRANYRGKP